MNISNIEYYDNLMALFSSCDIASHKLAIHQLKLHNNKYNNGNEKMLVDLVMHFIKHGLVAVEWNIEMKYPLPKAKTTLKHTIIRSKNFGIIEIKTIKDVYLYHTYGNSIITINGVENRNTINAIKNVFCTIRHEIKKLIKQL